jgi:DNA-binding transcriptional regulator GbsR (MarR family)
MPSGIKFQPKGNIMQDIKKLLQDRGFQSEISDSDIQIMMSITQDISNAETNLLRSIMQGAARRLHHNGPRHEIAHQLEEASSESFSQLARENVEIEIDEENIMLKTTQASNHENPLLAALYRAAALQDGISAIRIAGEEPSLDHHTELRTALKTLRDALNSDLKD